MARGIYKRGNVYWIRYGGPDGKIRYESSNSYRYRDAEILLTKRKQQMLEGRHPEILKVGNHKFSDLVPEYLKWAQRQKSFTSKRAIVMKLNQQFGDFPLRKIGPLLLEKYQTQMLNQGKRPATVNRHYRTLAHMFTKAVDWHMVEEEYLKQVRKVKTLQENNRRLRYLSQEECQKLIDQCDPHLRPIVITALNTGMRRGEILNLRWDNVDLQNRLILLDQDQTKNSQRKEIPINQTLLYTLKEVRTRRRLDVPYVFFNPATGKPFTDVKNAFRGALRRSGIKDFRFHDLRHTFASMLVMKGVDLTTVKELLGHKDVTMTLRYAHLAPSHKRNAVEILDSKSPTSPRHISEKYHNE